MHTLRPDSAHAIFSPSEKAWIRYPKEKIINKLRQLEIVQRGTELHELAANAIRLGVRLDESNGALAEYVSDAIDTRCDVEVQLQYSESVFGTADALKFDFQTKTLFIFDLKTGEKAVNMDQVLIYAAIWCLQNNVDPNKIDFDLRIYSNIKPIRMFSEESEEMVETIKEYMAQIVFVDNVANQYKGGAV